MPSWCAVMVFVVLASCAAVVIAGYVRGNRKARETASAKSAAAPPERGDNPEPQAESWLWG